MQKNTVTLHRFCNNQIVTTLNPNYTENDSIINVGNKELAKLPVIVEKKEAAAKNLVNNPAKLTAKKPETKAKEKPKEKAKVKKKTETKTVKKETAKPKASNTKPKAKVKVE